MKIKLHYFKELDGIRAIAALMIIFFHFFRSLHTNNTVILMVQKFATFGQTGVSLFFVLSGFLITRILLSTKEGPGYFLNFYLRRTLRIFPLYYFFLALWYFAIPLLISTDTPPFSEQIYFWTYLQNFAYTFKWPAEGPTHFWSLAVEEHFYLFWPFLVYFLSKKALHNTIWFLVIVALLVRVLLVYNGYGTFYFTFARIDELTIGGLLALWEVKGKLKTIKPGKFTIAIVILLLPTLGLWFATGGSGLAWIQVVKFIPLSFIYFCVVGFVVTASANHWVNRFLKWKFFSFTGKISYGLYVYHPACFLITEHYLKNSSAALIFLVGIVTSYTISFLSYHFFESKFLIFKKYFEYKSNDTKAPEKNAALE